jgi:hypothetical protein
MRESITTRLTAASGAVFVVLIIIGNSIGTSSDSHAAHPTGQEVLRDATRAAHSSQAHLGFVLELLAFVAQMVWIGFLATRATRTRRPEGEDRARLALGVALAAGCVELAVKLGSGAPMLALTLDRDHLSPELAQVLNDMNGASFVISWLPFAVFVAAAARGLNLCGLVGRPTAAIGLVVGAVGVPLAVLGTSDIAAANPVGFLLALLWTLVVSVRLAVKPSLQALPGDDSRAELVAAG